MKFSSPIAIAALLLAAQAPALAAEIAVLRNGFSIRCERREQRGNVTRLYTTNGYVDVPTGEIDSFEKEETPVAAVPAPVLANAPQPAPTASAQATAAPITSPPQILTKPSPVDIQELVREASARNRLDPDLVNSVIKAESDFYPKAVSSKGARGLMQLMPGTAALLGVNDPFDPKANVDAGTAHLSQLMDRYHDDTIKALAAYNAGAHRVDQYHGVPPYAETHAYVAKIIRDFNAKKRAQMKAAAPAGNNTAAKTGATAKGKASADANAQPSPNPAN